MSHVWDGFRIEAPSMDDALDVVDAFRPVALRMLQDWNARVIAEAATALIDRAHVFGKDVPALPLSTAWETVQDRRLRIVRTERRDPVVDPEFRLTLIRHDGRIYGLSHTEQADWRSAWLALPEVSDYLWYDGSDRPDEIDEMEWQERERTWHAMLPDMWPAGRGIVVVLTPRYFESSPDDVLMAVPDMCTRLRRAATDIALSRRMSQNSEWPEDVSDMVAAASHAAFWMGSDEGIAERDRLVSELRLPNIDLTTLMGFDMEKHGPAGRKDK